jgi:hypothetical protein
MVRILCYSLLSLALSIGALTAGDKDKVSVHQLDTLISAAGKLKEGGSVTVTLRIDDKEVSYTVTKDALGNITATGPANAEIQTIAIATGSSGGASSVPLAATIIAKDGSISSFNVATNAQGMITSISSTTDTTVVKTGPSLNQTTTTVVQTTTNGVIFTDTFNASTGGGTVSITYAPGTSPSSTKLVSGH